jgi:hypothetical protein
LKKDGNKTNSIVDSFKINQEGIIKKSTLINAEDFGVYDLYIAIASDPSDYLKRMVIVGSSSITGKVSFDFKDGQGVPYIIFLVIMTAGVYFIYRRHKKGVRSLEENVKP